MSKSTNFLSKKSWHVSSLKNQERVWKAEQDKEAELKKIEQLKKEKMEEEQIRDLKNQFAEASSGKKSSGMDWMYEGAFQLSLKKQETVDEYLMGKKIDDSNDNDLKKTASLPGALFINKTSNSQDIKNLVRDDPLLLIERKKQEQLDKIMNNPLQMKKLEKEKKESDKILKKLKKKEKKEKKRKEREERGERYSDSSDEEYRKLKKEKKRKEKEKDKRKESERYEERDSKLARKDNSGSDKTTATTTEARNDRESKRNEERDYREREERDYREREGKYRDRDHRDRRDSIAYDDRESRYREERDHIERESRYRDRDHRDRRDSRVYNDREREERDYRERESRYRDRDHDGSSKRESRYYEDRYKNRDHYDNHSNNRPSSPYKKRDRQDFEYRQSSINNNSNISIEQERMRKLEEMRKSGSEREEERSKKVKSDLDNEKEFVPKSVEDRGRTFFDQMNKDVYGDSASLGDALKRNKFYLEKS